MLIVGVFLLLSTDMSNKVSKQLTEKVWIQSNKDSFTYKNRRYLVENKHGYRFYEDGRLLIRQDLRWCGNGKSNWESIMGNWVQLSDSTVELTYDLWGYRNTLIGEFKFIESKNMYFNLQQFEAPEQIKPTPFLQF